MASEVWAKTFRVAGEILVGAGRLLGKALFHIGRATWRFLRTTLFPAIGRLYARLPLRWAVGGTLVVVLAAGVGAWYAWSSWLQPVLHAGQPELEAYPEGPWTDLAQRLTTAERLGDAVDVTREILARGGIATTDGERVLVAAIGPESPYRALTLETVNLAMEARRRRETGSLTVAEYAQMLHSFGWPVKDRYGHLVDPMAARDKGTSLLGTIENPDDPIDGIERNDAWRQAQHESREQARAEDQKRKRVMEAAIAEREAQTQQRVEELVATSNSAREAERIARQALSRARGEARGALEKHLQEARAVSAEANASLRQARQARRQARGDIQKQYWQEEQALGDREDLMRKIGPNYRAGEQFMQFLAVWANEAAKNPEDPHSFTPLFLVEMARLQDPPLDLLGSRDLRPGRAGSDVPVDLGASPRSQQMRLTLLEMQLIGAAFARGQASGVASSRTPGNMERMASSLMDIMLSTAKAAPSPEMCTAFKESFGDVGGEVVGAVGSEALGKAVETYFGAQIGDAEALGKAMSITGTVMKVVKLAAFYKNSEVTVAADPASTHKPDEGKPTVRYTATAGVSAEALKEYEEALGAGANADRFVRDCFGTFGLPFVAEIADVAKDAENWLIEWRLTDGSPQHAWISLSNNDFYLRGKLAMKMERVSPSSAQARLVVDIRPEEQDEGDIVRAYVTARASVDAAPVPGIGMLVNTGKGVLGLADNLVELAAGWIQTMVKPRSYATVQVEYHVSQANQCVLCPCDESVEVCADGCRSAHKTLRRGTEKECGRPWPDREQRLSVERK